MKTYSVDIAPEYSDLPHSLTNGQHGCTVKALTLDDAKVLVLSRAARESWPMGHALIVELDKRGQKIRGLHTETVLAIPMHDVQYKALREGLKLTQSALADRLGVSLRTIANRESGVHPISHEAAVAIRSLSAAPK